MRRALDLIHFIVKEGVVDRGNQQARAALNHSYMSGSPMGPMFQGMTIGMGGMPADPCSTDSSDADHESEMITSTVLRQNKHFHSATTKAHYI